MRISVAGSALRKRTVQAAIVAMAVFLVVATPAVGAGGHAVPNIASGGTINVRDLFSGDFSCVDPQKGPNATDVGMAVFDTLLSGAPHGRLEPGIASSWKVTNGGKLVTFKLRHGLRFANGDPLNANAVKFTFDRAINLHFPGEVTASALGPLKSIQVVSKYVVRFIMSAPFRPLLSALASEYGAASGILDPKTTTNKTCLTPMGSGPFKIAGVGPGLDTISLVRNRYYGSTAPWIHNHGRAYLKQINFQSIVSDSTAASELLSGQLDIAQVTGDQLGRIKGNKSISQHRVLYTGELMVVYNQKHGPFASVAVRRAIGQAINRRDMIKVGLGGLGVPALSNMPISLPYYSKAAAALAPKYNPNAAKRVLSAHHVTSLTLLTLNMPETVADAQLIQAELAQTGVNVKIDSTDFGGFLSAANSGKFDLELQEWSGSDPDVAYYIYDPAGGYDWMFKDYKTVDKLITAGDETLNQKKAAADFGKMQLILAKQVAVDPVYTQTKVFGVRSRVGGFHTTEDGLVAYQDLYIK
jgi:peptide/nickel transport system substrate-binding protein